MSRSEPPHLHARQCDPVGTGHNERVSTKMYAVECSCLRAGQRRPEFEEHGKADWEWEWPITKLRVKLVQASSYVLRYR
jgi:hypothetical protein